LTFSFSSKRKEDAFILYSSIKNLMQIQMKKISQDLFHQFNFLNNLAVSRDGTVCFVGTKQDVEKNSYVSHIYQLKDGEVRQLTSGKNESSFFFEGENILFTARRSEDKTVHTEFYRLDLKQGGEASLAFSVPVAGGGVKDIGDYYLMTGSTDLYCPDYHLISAEEREKYDAEKTENEDYQVVDEYPFFFNGAGFINKTRTSLYLINKADFSVERITPPTMDVESSDYLDGEILYTGIDYDAVKGKWSQVYCYSIEDRRTDCLYEKADMIIHGARHYKGKVLVIGTYGEEFGVTESSKFYFLENGKMDLFIGKDMSFWSSVGTDSKWGRGKSMDIVEGEMYLTPTLGPNSPLAVVDGDDFKYLTDFKGTVNDFCVTDNGIFLIAMEGQKLQEIYKVNDDGSLNQLSHINTPVLEDYYVAVPERVIVNKEPCSVEGWVLKPFGYDPAKKYPAILDIHGGPRSAYGEVYYHEMQYWASEGFFVMYCNPHGSDGYGNAFADIRKEKYGTIDYEDIMDFCDEVIRKFPVDEKRVAVTGGSYGGYMTNWIIGHTDRFCCAASQRSISNWMSMMLASDYGLDVPFEHGFDDIYDCTEGLWRASPLKYADNVKTPTLFIHSFEDYRCPVPEGYQLFTAIRAQGVDARMCLFKGENHELSRSGKPKHRSRRLKEITDWIKKYTA